MKKALIFLAAALLAACSGNNTSSLPRGKASEELQAGFEVVLDSVKASASEPIDYMRLVNLHSLLVLKDGEIVIEKYFPSWPQDKPHPMFSVSKTFTAAAVGIAISEGRMKLTDKVADYFPDKVVEDNPCYATVEDLLSMSGGHDTDPTMDVLEFDLKNLQSSIKKGKEDLAQVFFSHPFVHQPGTFNCYNSLGTYLLSAIITKLSGQTLLDYLTPRLFEPLGIEKPTWDADDQGINYGGWGLRLVPEDMAKMGLLLLHEGNWKGRQLIPASWVKAMGTKHVESTPANVRIEDSERICGRPDALNDWRQGYGYQTWLNVPEGFRADGAGGQFILVLPEKKAVVVLTAWLSDAQKELDLIWNHIYPYL